MWRTWIAVGLAGALVACSGNVRQDNAAESETTQIYQLLDSSRTHITFSNNIPETRHLNPLIYDTYLNGSGVGVLDVNNDGLEDLFFAGNHVTDRLYLNKGDLRFEDITERAGIRQDDGWSGGVAIADVNGDGWDDIYVCRYLFDEVDRRRNLFYENQGDGTFIEKSEVYGINDPGYSMCATFLDHDKDGDLDLYVGNQPPTSIYERKKYTGVIDYRFSDRFYRNDDGKFVEATVATGLANYAYALSTTACDLNNDGWTDIYVANDYEEPDHLYLNNGDGTFTNAIHEAIRHISNFSMGADIADINNDGWQDIFVADMVAKDHFRNKTNMSGMNPEKFWRLANAGYHFQYMFNALQLNNGNGTFSEIAQMAGVSHTDWSWAALFIDMDQDGLKDLFVTNGQLRDTRNKDFEIYRDKEIAARKGLEDGHELLLDIIQQAPQTKLANYALRNEGDLTFATRQDDWGLHPKTWTQGAAYADLDNDGDLDLILNNQNEVAHVYESRANDRKIGNYIAVQVTGTGKNTRALNARATVTCNGVTQVMELTPVRGYMSTVQDILHFGLGTCDLIDKLEVVWPDGKVWSQVQVPANQTLKVEYAQAQMPDAPGSEDTSRMFEQWEMKAAVVHKENDYDDYATEILLPYKLSTLGPFCATGDVNDDGTDDLYLGGSAGSPGKLFMMDAYGQLRARDIPVFARDAQYEDGGAHFFDADADGDLDLYVASGGNEFPAGSSMYADRLYLNDGKGQFERSAALPPVTESTSAIVPLDYDADGDLDLFVGGRQVPQNYGRIPGSILLRNDDGQYTDVSAEGLPNEGALGLVTTAAWADIDGSGTVELIVAGEWMPLSVLAWNGEAFTAEEIPSLSQTRGLWNRILVTDVDGDGDKDVVAGNLGLNNKYEASPEMPFKLYVNDFDDNGSNDVYLGYYDQADGHVYPVRGRECSSQQMPFVKKKYASYESFANASIEQVLEGKLDDAIEQEAQMFASGIFYNDGDMQFRFSPFVNNVQVAPVYGIVATDFNGDGRLDLLLAGNYYNREVETTRSDAGIGAVLLGGNDGFSYVHPARSGIAAYRDVRDAFVLNGAEEMILGIANNNSEMQFYRLASRVVQ